MSLDRFHSAQAGPDAGYDTALAEIRAGRKTGHWIWYVFPQLQGLGHSATARAYALRDLAEACAYLRDPVLRGRYEEIAGAVRAQLIRGLALTQLMGSQIDALKLVSSLTLFRVAARSLTSADPASARLAEEWDALLGLLAAQGFPPCALTLARLAG
jgi:uncharacterized protein (DUF1810 family)